MPSQSLTKKLFSDRINIGVLLFIAAVFFCLSWSKWVNVWVDFGDDLFIQWKILNGATLYKDIAYFRGPFHLYFNAALLKLFGTNLNVLLYSQFFLILTLIVLIYRFFNELFGSLTAFLSGLIFITIFAFASYAEIGNGNFNFVCPYTYAIVQGYFFCMLGLYIYLRFIKNGSRLLLFLLGIITGITFLIKNEIFLAFFLSLIIGFLLWNIHLRKSSDVKPGVLIVILTVGFLIPFVSFLFYFSSRMSFPSAFQALTLQYVYNENIPKNQLYLHSSGLDAPFKNIQIALSVALSYALAFIYIGVYVLSRERRPLLSKILLILGLCLGIQTLSNFPLFIDIFRPFPFILLISFFLLMRRLGKPEFQTPSSIALCVFIFFALILAIKVILGIQLHGYSFVLALPGVLILAAIFLNLVPVIFARFFHGSESQVQQIILVLIGVVIIAHVYREGIVYSKMNIIIPAVNEEAVFKVIDRKGNLQFKEALEYVKRLKPNETFLVLPEGTLLNYLSRRDTGTHCFKLAAAELSLWGEGTLLKEIQEHPPNYILYKGWRRFGKDYGKQILPWVLKEYHLVKTIHIEDASDVCILAKN